MSINRRSFLAAAGLPAIGSRLNAIPEIIEDGATGLLVPPGDPARGPGQLPDRIGDPNNGPQTVEKFFNTEAFAAPAQYTFGNAGIGTVTGPGIKAVIDDAKDADAKEGRLLDVDLQQLVNGLWTSGAEAVSVNGHRITSLTAIRGAGSAITVDYSSLTPPYTVLAIGDTATMPARFAQSSGGQWVQYLVSNFDVRMTITTEDSLQVPADATIALRYAKVRTR